MPVISIIGCRMFEDEIMHLLEKDPEIEKVIVVENNDCDGLRKKCWKQGSRIKCSLLKKFRKSRKKKVSP
ncbi:MAG: hypothetical protein NHB15_01605 [Methanosarcina barkeri]|nr:hypothetical protein [Methanosarcina sp. ERenArc_MAG2]